jgi:hypothetical protein
VSTKTVGQIEQALAVTGQPITDPDNGVTRPRIDVADALAELGVAPGPGWHAWESFGGTLSSNPKCLSTRCVVPG